MTAICLWAFLGSLKVICATNLHAFDGVITLVPLYAHVMPLTPILSFPEWVSIVKIV